MIGESLVAGMPFSCSSEANLSQEESCSAEHLEGWNGLPTSIRKGFLTKAS